MDKGELVDEVNLVTAQLYKEMLGKGPQRVRSTICEDLLIIRIERTDTIIFNHLSSIDKGREALKLMGRKLFNLFEEDAKKRYEKIIDKKIKKILYDSQKVEKEIVLTIISESNIL